VAVLLLHLPSFKNVKAVKKNMKKVTAKFAFVNRLQKLTSFRLAIQYIKYTFTNKIVLNIPFNSTDV
jgi:hypothetical protein